MHSSMAISITLFFPPYHFDAYDPHTGPFLLWFSKEIAWWAIRVIIYDKLSCQWHARLTHHLLLSDDIHYIQGFWYFAQSRSREFQVNPWIPAKFTKTRENLQNPLEILPNTCWHNIFESYLGCWDCLLAKLPWNLASKLASKIPAKFPQNRPFFPQICPWKSRKNWLFFHDLPEALYICALQKGHNYLPNFENNQTWMLITHVWGGCVIKI